MNKRLPNVCQAIPFQHNEEDGLKCWQFNKNMNHFYGKPQSP